MKKVVLVFVLVLMVISFYGCTPSNTSIKETSSSPDWSKLGAKKDSTYRPDWSKLEKNIAVTPTVISSDETYGYTEENPINVGGVYETGPLRKRQYLNCLLGPNGEEITYYRIGSCCHFDTPHGFLGTGLLDKFHITYQGLEEPIILYLNQYDYEKPMAPKGFTIKE